MMSTLLTSRFWLAAAERAAKTMAQSLVALIGANAVAVTDLDWPQLLGVSATAALVSILTSIASAGVGPHGPSLADESIVTPLVTVTADQPDVAPLTLTGPDKGAWVDPGQPIDPDAALGQ
jgi:hypothetical protein